MKNVDILKAKDKQINKLIELVNKLMKQSEKLLKEIENQKYPPYAPPTIIPNDQTCSDGGMHDYPNPWGSTSPPPCKKCGHLAPGYLPTWTTNGTNSSGNFPFYDTGKASINNSVTMTQEEIENALKAIDNNNSTRNYENPVGEDSVEYEIT